MFFYGCPAFFRLSIFSYRSGPPYGMIYKSLTAKRKCGTPSNAKRSKSSPTTMPPRCRQAGREAASEPAASVSKDKNKSAENGKDNQIILG